MTRARARGQGSRSNSMQLRHDSMQLLRCLRVSRQLRCLSASLGSVVAACFALRVSLRCACVCAARAAEGRT